MAKMCSECRAPCNPDDSFSCDCMKAHSLKLWLFWFFALFVIFAFTIRPILWLVFGKG